MELHNSGPDKFGQDDAAELQNSDNAAPRSDAATTMAPGVSRVLTAGPDGVVVLPAGTELGDIQIDGRDLVIIGADGVRYVIPDGAIVVPQLVVGDVAIPPLNLAALLVGNEPQPAAGNAQSSGGNFASAVGPLQPAYALGDLLPYTELSFPQPEEQEIIPAVADRDPEIIIITVDQPVGAQSATATVAESGLPARSGEPAGTNASASSEVTSGTIVFTSPDGVASITINGVAFTGVGQIISSPRGDLVITSYDPVAGTIGFTYTLTDNLVGGTLADEFAVSITDPDGDVATATLTVSAIDDAPIARNDTDAVAAGSYAPESGNVVTAAGTTSGAAGADTPGADGAAVSRIASNNVPANSDTTFDAAGNLQVAGQYGTLLIQANGSYTYTRAAGTPGGVADAFTYTLTDADGSTSTATLTINIGDATPTITTLPPPGDFDSGTLVFESGLPARPGEAPGTNAPAPTETTGGTIRFTGGDGPLSATINGVTVAPGATVTIPGVGTLTVNTFNPVTGVLTYSFTLADNTSGDNTSATFNVVVTDVDGDAAPGTFVIAIRDDSPRAQADSATQSVENAPVTVNVLVNDTQGADSVQASTVQLVDGTLSGTGTLVNNGDGTFTYTPGPGENGPVTFNYSITDGDGDPSTATVTIVLIADSTPVVGEGPNLAVDEDGFANANADATPLQADPAEADAGENLSDSGTVTVDFGGDVPADLAASIVLLDDPAYDGQLQTLSGDPVVFAVEGGALVGRDGGGAEVIRITVTGAVAGPNPGEVVYTYATQLSQPVQHATAGTEDTVTLGGVTFRVTDLDGDTATGSFSVSVSDDVPTALDEAGGSLAEGATVTGTLDFVSGADGATVTAIDGTALVFGADGFSQAVTLFDATDTIPVGTITVKADGTYSFTAADPLNNPVGALASFTVTDGDGDASTATITFSITDANAPTGGTAQAALDDDGLAGGNPASTTFDLATDAGDALADSDESTFAGTLTFTDGGDSPATITFAAGVDGSFATVGTERVQYTVTGDTLTAIVSAEDAGGAAQARAGTTLFTVQITDATAGTYLVTLVDNILHAGGPNEENPVGTDASASIGFTVTDSDGSTAAATLAITFDDDAPTASAVSVTQAAENGTILVDITGSYAAGADGVDLSQVTWTQPAQGTIVYDGAGHFTYTPAAGAGSISLGDSFTYTVVDGDGDTATATVAITLQPDSAPVANDATALVDDDGLPAGNAASNPAGTDDDQNAGEAGAGTASEAVWTGSLSVQAGANDTPLTYTLASAAGSGTVGTEAVDFTYDEASHTLTATVAAGEARAGTVLFTVAINDVNTGAYTVTLVNPIMHPSLDGQPGDDTENNVSVALTFTVSDSDPVADSDTGTLTIDFDDDTPTASAVAATQAAENAAFDIPLAGQFDAGADGLASITFTQPSQGAVVLNGTTFTYTPAAGAGSVSTSDSFSYTVTDADGDSVTQTVSVTLQPDSTPMFRTASDLAVDEDGFANANVDAAPLQGAPAETDGTESLTDASGVAVFDFGNDVPATLAGSAVLVDTAALDGQLTTLAGDPVVFKLEGGDLVGRAGSDAGAEVIRISLTGASAGANPGEVNYSYSVTLSQPVQHTTSGIEDLATLAGVTIEVTDLDGDKITGTFDVTVRDDVPSLDVTVGPETGVVLTTQDAETDGDPTASDSATSTVGMVSAGFGGVFGLTFAKGADDGPTPSLSYVLGLKTDGGLSGLESQGAPIYLHQLDDQTVVGSTSAANPGSLDGTAVFSVSVAADGTVTLVQYQQIDHPLADDPDASDAPFDDQFASLADDLITLTASSSLTDGDGDTASDSETIAIGANLRFADDGPVLTGAVTAADGVTIDETTAGPPAGFGTGIVASSLGAAITFAEAFGADGPAVGGGLTYSIEITGPMGASPFVTAVGDYPVTLVQVDADTIEGRYIDGAMVEQTAFRLDIGSDGGLTLTQFVALEHVQDGNTAPDYDDALYLTADGTAGGASLVSARITVTDFDGDTATGAAAIGSNVTFRDDGVDAVLDANSVSSGSYAPIMGNVLDNDYRGADGSAITAVSNADAGTSGTLAGNEITIQGEYGVLVVNVNTGAYTYTRDPGVGGGEQDVFSYTLTDSDGDFDSATLTISIGNLTPVAGTAQATVDDDGLANGNPNGTGDIDANTPAGRTADLDQMSTEAVFKGMLGGTLGDGTNTFTFLSMQSATTVGQETVSYSVSPDGSTLTATITSSPAGRTGTLFTVEITDQTTGAYTLTLAQPVLHDTLDGMTGDNQENDAGIDLAYQITDQDNDSSAAPGTLNVLFDDDTPTVTPNVITVTQAAENDAFDFTLVEGTHFFEGADGVDLATGVTFTQASQGTISYDDAGTFTYTPASGAGSNGNTSDSFTFTVTDADGDSVTKTVNVTLQPDSVPVAGTPTDLALDEDGLAGANADGGQTDPAEVTGTNSASDLTGSVVVDYGDDVPADLLGSVALVDLAAYDTQIKTLDGNFVTFALELNTTTMRDELVGRSAGGDEVIRIAVTGATAGPNPGEVTYTYSTTLSLPIQHETAGTEDIDTLAGITLRFTDGDDSDTTTASFDVTVRDDVPSLDVTVGPETGVVLTTQDAETDGDPTASDSATSTVGMVSAGFGGVFGLTFAKGADDGPTPSLSYALGLKTDGGLSGLESQGAPIYLHQLDDQTVVGSTSAANPGSLDGTAVFSVSVAADGTVTLVQYQQIDHPLADDPDASDAPFDDQFASLADDLITLTASSSLTDGDGDTASDSETIAIGANLRFADDGPVLTGAVTAADGVTIDETTAGPPAGFGTGIVASSLGAAITFAEAFGADGPAVGGGLTYSIEITGPMGASPFVTAVGDYPVTLVQVDADTIEGRYIDGAMVEQTAFRLDIGSDGGLTLTQFVALEHVQDGNTAPDYDDALYLTADGTAGGASLVSARITVTDFDGDTATGAAAIGSNVTFRDDGVDAVLDANSVSSGSYAPIMGNVLDNDYRGADGSAITAVSNADAGTSGTLAGNEITIQGEYGVLVVNVNTGAYTYTRDPGVGGGEQDVFSYTLTDSDGDFDSATLTISIGNLTPVAGTAQATVDDDGLANGNPNGTGDIDANTPAGRTADLDQMSTEAVFKGMLGGTLGDGTNTFTFLSMQSATTVGQETVSYSVSPDGSTLTATITSSPAGRTGTLFTVEITDQTTGAYTLTLAQPVLHDTLNGQPGDDQENDAGIDLAYQITDQDNDSSAAPGTLNVLFDDDTPIAKTVVNTSQTDDEGKTPYAAASNEGATAGSDVTGTPSQASGGPGALFAAGADGFASVSISTATTVLGIYDDAGIPKQETVTYSTSVDAMTGATTLTATGDQSNAVVFTVTVGTDGSYTFTQHRAIVHPSAGEDDLDIVFDFTVRDADGDGAAGSLTVTVDDDTPVVSPDTDSLLAGATGPATGNVLANDSTGADGGSVTAITGAGGAGAIGGTTTGAHGTLTINADGSYSYTRFNGNPIDATDTFTYTLTDGDGDSASTTLIFTLKDNGVTVGANAIVRLDDDAKSNGIAGGIGDDIDAQFTSGTLSGSGGDGGLTFTFATTGNPIGFSYVANGTGIDVFQGGTKVLAITLDSSTGAYSVTQVAPIVHATGNNENNQEFTLSYTVSDADGDSAPGSLSINVDDDSPAPVVTQNAVVTNATGSGTFALDTAGVINNLVADNYGADGPGGVRFSTDTSIYPNLQSNGVPITYTVSPDQLTLTAKAGATTVFTVTLNPGAATPSYSVQMFATVDSTTTINFNDGTYDFLGGNDPWAGFVPNGQNPNRPGGVPIDDNSSDLLLTPIGASGSAINGTANSAGVTGGGAGQNIGTGEGIRLDFVSDLRGDPAGSPNNYQGNVSQQDHVFDNHVPTNNASVRFGDGTGNTTISIKVYNVTDINNGPAPDIVLGQGTLSNISAISVSFDGDVKIFTYPGAPGSQTQLVGTPGTGLADRNYTVEWVSEGGVIYAKVTGTLDTNVSVATTGASSYNALEILYLSGSDFELTGFGSASVTNTPVSFALPIEVVDADGDVAASFLDLTMKPATGTIEGSGAIAATLANPNVIGSDGSDTITGTSANNVIVGGKGADTLTGNGGNDVFVIDPSHITAVNDDTITDYNAGDIVDLRALIGSFGANGAMNGTQASQTIRLFGNALQVDDNGTAAGTNWVTVAILSNNPTSVTVLYDFSEATVTLNRIAPPVVLDLDGDGVEFTAIAAGTTYDYGGGAVGTAWVGGDDGILVFDANGNANIDGAFEFEFGSHGQTDLEALRARYGDALDAADADFAKFGVWQDANGDGVSDVGEFHSLGDLGIVSINLTADGVPYVAGDGDVSVAGSSTYTRADGSTGALADAAFATDAKAAQRTAEILTTAALAGAALNALPAAAQPAMADANRTTGEITSEGLPTANDMTAGSKAETAEGRPSLPDIDRPESDDAGISSQHIGGESSEAHFIANDTAFDDVGQPPAWLAADAVPQVAATGGGLFAGMGAEGTMQALLAIGPQAASTDTAPAAAALAAIDNAMSDFRGEVLVDDIVARFTAADRPVADWAQAAGDADAGPFMLMQGIGGSGAHLTAMIDLPDASDDASLLAAAQA